MKSWKFQVTQTNPPPQLLRLAMVWYPWTQLPDEIHELMDRLFLTGSEDYVESSLKHFPRVQVPSSFRAQFSDKPVVGPFQSFSALSPPHRKYLEPSNLKRRLGNSVCTPEHAVRIRGPTTFDALKPHFSCFNGAARFPPTSWPICDADSVGLVHSLVRLYGSPSTSPAFVHSSAQTSCTHPGTVHASYDRSLQQFSSILQPCFDKPKAFFDFSSDFRPLRILPLFRDLLSSRIREFLYCFARSSPDFRVFIDVLSRLNHIVATSSPVPTCPGILFYCPIGSGKSTLLSSLPLGAIDTDWIAPLLDGRPELLSCFVNSGFSVLSNRWDLSPLTCPRIAFRFPKSVQISRLAAKGIYADASQQRRQFDLDIIHRNKRDTRTVRYDAEQWLSATESVANADWTILDLGHSESVSTGISCVYTHLLTYLLPPPAVVTRVLDFTQVDFEDIM